MLENFLSFATPVVMNEGTLTIGEGLDFFLFSGIALALAFLMARFAKQKGSSFKKHDVLKKCPKCAEQLPLPTLVCDTCDYNFLSGTVGHRHKLLPSPSDALAHEVSEQVRA
jgi:hypothetical protein